MRYLNNAGTSWPKPPDVAEAVARVHAAAPADRSLLFEAAHASVCRFFNVQEPERLLLTGGCTQALAVAIGDLPWGAGDVVLTSALEHHALARPVAKLALERGVVHHAVGRASDAPLDLEQVEQLLQAGRVRLIAVTHASNVTGELLPVAELAALAGDHDALLLVDAAQTAGVLPLDLEALGADIVTFAGHKLLLGPQGIGGLWARPGVVFASPWASCEVGAGGARPPCSPMPGYCDVGSVNLAGAVGLAAALDWLEQRGVAEHGARARRLADRLTGGLAERGVEVLGGSGERTAARSLQLPGLALGEVEARFAAEGLAVRAGQHCAPRALEALGVPEGTLRISFGPFNERADVERVLSVVDMLRS